MRATPSTKPEAELDDTQLARLMPQVPVFQFVTSQSDRLFARQIALTGDIAQAMTFAFPEQSAGKTASQLRASGARLMAKDSIDEQIQYYRMLLAEKMDMTENRILKEITAIATANPKDFHNASGQLKNIHELPDYAACAIDSMESGTRKDGEYTKIKLHNKLVALKLLSEIKNMTEDHQKAKAPQIRIQLPQHPEPKTRVIEHDDLDEYLE